MDNHIDMKHEELMENGARVYYKGLRKYMRMDRSRGRRIGHSEHGEKNFISRHHPQATPDDVKWGY